MARKKPVSSATDSLLVESVSIADSITKRTSQDFCPELPRSERIKKNVKDCPWCPQDDPQFKRLYFVKSSDGSVAVGCWDCGSVGPFADKRDEARKAWNSRKA